MYYSRWDFGRDILVADIEDWRDRIHPRRLNAKEVLTQQRLTILSSQSQKEQQNCLEEITVSENTLQGGNNLQGAKISGKNFKETRRGFNRQKQKMTLKHSMTYKQWKERSFIVITSNLEFSSTCRKKKLSVFHWNTLMLSGLLIQIWMCYKRNVLTMITRNVDPNRHLSDSWKGFTKFTLLKEKPPKRYMWSGGDWQRFKRRPDLVMYGQKFGRKLVTPLRIEKDRNGQKKD